MSCRHAGAFCKHLFCKISICIAWLIYSVSAVAQPNRRDSTSNPLRIDIKNSSFAIRAGLGIQGSFCYEVGLARNSFIGSPHGLAGSGFYAVFASIPAFKPEEATVSGFRVGADLYGNGGFLGIEAGSFWAGPQQDVLVAPKIGLGIPNFGIFYAYHFSTNDWALPRVARHAVGVQVSPYLWHHDKLRGKKKWFWMRNKSARH